MFPSHINISLSLKSLSISSGEDFKNWESLTEKPYYFKPKIHFKPVWRSPEKKCPPAIGCTFAGHNLYNPGLQPQWEQLGRPQNEKITSVTINLWMSCTFYIITGEFDNIGKVA